MSTPNDNLKPIESLTPSTPEILVGMDGSVKAQPLARTPPLGWTWMTPTNPNLNYLVPIQQVCLAKALVETIQFIKALGQMVGVHNTNNYHQNLTSDHADSTVRLCRGTIEAAFKMAEQTISVDKHAKHAMRITKAALGCLYAVNIERDSVPGIKVLTAWATVMHYLLNNEKSNNQKAKALDDWRDFLKGWSP